MHEIPVVDPASADGVFSLLWVVIALPLLGAVILLVGGAIVPRIVDRWGHLLGCILPIGSFLAIGIAWMALLAAVLASKIHPLRVIRASFVALPFVAAAVPLMWVPTTRPGATIGSIPATPEPASVPCTANSS